MGLPAVPGQGGRHPTPYPIPYRNPYPCPILDLILFPNPNPYFDKHLLRKQPHPQPLHPTTHPHTRVAQSRLVNAPRFRNTKKTRSKEITTCTRVRTFHGVWQAHGIVMTSALATHYFDSVTVANLKCTITYMFLGFKNPKNSAIRKPSQCAMMPSTPISPSPRLPLLQQMSRLVVQPGGKEGPEGGGECARVSAEFADFLRDWKDALDEGTTLRQLSR